MHEIITATLNRNYCDITDVHTRIVGNIEEYARYINIREMITTIFYRNYCDNTKVHTRILEEQLK